MCGIAGFIQKERDPELLFAMLGRLRHRGPDGDGSWIGSLGDYHVHLGHRRLSIIDIEGGAQPMANEDEKLWMTYNGEVYNFRELRRPLEASHRFASRSDTEVIIHHLEEHGPSGLSDLNGMFALGLWDGRDGTLTLARDRAGVKPLYYVSLPDGGIAFASELSALLCHPAIPRRLSREGLLSYVFSDYALPPWSLIDGVKKLTPAGFLTWRAGQITGPSTFFQLRKKETPRFSSDAEAAEVLWSRLGTAVERQMVADVPVGVFLSGGLDSSSVAALATRKARGKLRTFSIGFEEKSFDESGYARIVAKHIGSDHTEEIVGAKTLLDRIETVVDSLDEPLSDHSYLPTYLLSEMAAKHVKVVLGGDGGDELWGGYPTYLAHRFASLYALIPRVFRREVIERMIDALPVSTGYQGLDWKLRRFSGRWDDDPLRRHFRWLSSVDLPELPRALPWSRGAEPATLSAPYPALGDGLDRLLGIDFSSYMHASVLTKVDRASMQHSLEVRPPILDNDFIDWSFSMPARLKLRGTVGKYLFKRAARPHLPAEIIDRPKRGFGIPLVSWMRGPLLPAIDDVLRDSILWDSGLFDRDVYRGYRDDHAAGRIDAAKPLWAMFVLARWARRERITG